MIYSQPDNTSNTPKQTTSNAKFIKKSYTQQKNNN